MTEEAELYELPSGREVSPQEVQDDLLTVLDLREKVESYADMYAEDALTSVERDEIGYPEGVDGERFDEDVDAMFRDAASRGDDETEIADSTYEVLEDEDMFRRVTRENTLRDMYEDHMGITDEERAAFRQTVAERYREEGVDGVLDIEEVREVAELQALDEFIAMNLLPGEEEKVTAGVRRILDSLVEHGYTEEDAEEAFSYYLETVFDL